jgi:hypothetical protein
MFNDATLNNYLETSSSVSTRSAVIAEWNLNTFSNIFKLGNYRYRKQKTVTVNISQTTGSGVYGNWGILVGQSFILLSETNQQVSQGIKTFVVKDTSGISVGSVFGVVTLDGSGNPVATLGGVVTAIDSGINLINTFSEYDDGNFYTNATDADVVVDAGFNDDGTPATSFKSKKEKIKMLYSLEDCFNRFRPRSGINKAMSFGQKTGHFIHHSHPEMSKRPRYYMGDKQDMFKYWTSFRTENGIERGIANRPVGNTGTYEIDDAAPFVVYKKPVPANRVVVKMQTNVGTVDLGPFSNSTGKFNDPLYGDANRTTPVKWKIQYLDGTDWKDAISFDINSKRKNGLQVIGADGYVEIAYGLILDDKYTNTFVHAQEIVSTDLLPSKSFNGYAYLVKKNPTDVGTYYIWSSELQKFESFVPKYGWYLVETDDTKVPYVTDLTNPQTYIGSTDGKSLYREFSYVGGLRVVAETMNKFDSTFDLIEISPRLAVDLAEKTKGFAVTKAASDLGISGMPVSQLLASTGSLDLFDYDLAFSSINPNSILNLKDSSGNIVDSFTSKNLQIKLYEVITNVDGYEYFVPVKTLYSEGFPQENAKGRTVNISLRDMFFYFESLTAPQILIPNVSVSYAVSLLLDSIGFSNYTFKRVPGEKEAIIPYFFISPEKTVAQVLNDIAISTQTAMFFDEYNNFIMMSKNYMMPANNERSVDMTLYGSKDFAKSGIVNNKSTNSKLSNIIDISSQENQVYNDGKISFISRSIQRSYGSIRQANMVDTDKTWIYKPALLWEIAGTEDLKSINHEVASQSNYVLGAIPLNTDLSDVVPSVSNFKVINNTMDLGEGIYWITRYNGYFYANGEVIRYDAVQFNIPGLSTIDPTNPNVDGNNVWITSSQEYGDYFSKVPFNGKIYPTGLIRIYSEPNYEVADGKTRLSNGPVAKHGRGQFGTDVVYHQSGLAKYWSSDDNVRGCTMDSTYLFNNTAIDLNVTAVLGDAGINNSLAKKSRRNGIIKNFMSTSSIQESDVNNLLATQTGTIQSSALVFTGPELSNGYSPLDFVSYVYKPLNNNYKHFGTRMRIIGQIENNPSSTFAQTPSGASTYYSSLGIDPGTMVNIGGSSGGIGVMVNPSNNNGYYFEIAALTSYNVDGYADNNGIQNVLFYKVMQKEGTTQAIPVPLWSGFSQVIVDDGNFTGQSRMAGETNPTVYDLAVEYQDIGSTRRFFLYMNNRIVATVDDTEPLPNVANMALFVRGAARCMFENVYALTNNYTQSTSFGLQTPVNTVFADSEINANEAFSKYAMSGFVKSTYLAGISSNEPPKYKMYFDEFGTIMREAAYMNVKYDKAFPALYAKISPTFNRIRGYTVSGFRAGSYGAEFLIFNSTDTALSLDPTSGNYLRIQGVTFTQESSEEVSMDDYFAKKSDFSNPVYKENSLVESPYISKKDFEDIKFSRMTYGKKEFSIEAPYVQTRDDAKELMGWVSSKIMKPRKSVGVKIFAMPTLQLGDIVNIDYKDNDGVDIIASLDKKFVVYNIEYSKSESSHDMTIFLSEVV